VSGHLAEHEHAVAAAQRAHAESVEYAFVRKTPVAPCQKAGEIRLEIVGAETIAAEHGIAAQQDPPIPDFWLLRLLMRKMRGDVGTPFSRERPGPRPILQIELHDAMNGER